MGESSFNPIDLAVIAVIAISALLAFVRGFVREVLSIAGWVGAAFVTLYSFPVAAQYSRDFIESRMVADAVAAIGVFVVALILFSIVTHMISERVQDSSLSAIDRSLGVVFGVFRGAVVVSLAYMFAVYLWADDQPALLAQARTKPMMVAGSDAIRELLPSDMSAAEREAERLRREAERALDLENATNPRPAAGSGRPDTDRGYAPQERGQFEQLIRTTPTNEPPPPSRD